MWDSFGCCGTPAACPSPPRPAARVQNTPRSRPRQPVRLRSIAMQPSWPRRLSDPGDSAPSVPPPSRSGGFGADRSGGRRRGAGGGGDVSAGAVGGEGAGGGVDTDSRSVSLSVTLIRPCRYHGPIRTPVAGCREPARPGRSRCMWRESVSACRHIPDPPQAEGLGPAGSAGASAGLRPCRPRAHAHTHGKGGGGSGVGALVSAVF